VPSIAAAAAVTVVVATTAAAALAAAVAVTTMVALAHMAAVLWHRYVANASLAYVHVSTRKAGLKQQRSHN
jgi:hypothetical protein